MTLEEAIERFEKLASDYEFNLDMHQRNVMKLSINDIERMKRNAQENRQLAEWLRELEAYIKIISELSEALHFYDGCEKCQGFREYPTSDFVDDVRGWVKQFEEVNTDES